MTDLLLGSELELQLASLGEELHAFLEKLPSYLRKGRVEELRQRCQALLDKFPNAHLDERLAKLKVSLAELQVALDGRARAYVMPKYEAAARAYEGWRVNWRTTINSYEHRAEVSLRALKPLKVSRAVFHSSMGVLAFVCYQFLLTQRQAVFVLLTINAVFLTLEITRRMSRRWNHVLNTKVFKLIARPGEYTQVNSATFYVTALCLLTPVFSKAALLAGVLILAFGDPAAAWFGRRWGKTKLYKNKSIVGTVAFAIAGALIAGTYLLVFAPQYGVGARVAAAIVASIAGAIAEVFSDRIDDNLTVPVAAVLTAAAIL
jgi:dolichol kinase